MRRLKRMATLGAVVGVGLVGGSEAAAQEPAVELTPLPGDVAAAIVEDGWYADPESVGDREQLDQVAERLANQGEPMGFALLAEEPPGSSPAYAEDVLDALPSQPGQRVRTVVVLSDADVGVVSDFWSDQAIDDALDETIDDLRADPTDGLEALADALAAAPSGFDDGGSDTGDDDSGPNTGLIALGVVALGGVALASRYWSSSTGGDGYDDSYGDSYDDGGSSRARRLRRSSFRRSSSSRRSSSGGSSRRSSSGSRRGRGGRRL
ncbi:MAG TPA: hypothetical protein VK611_01940 [Acidimicrobiales bacterium]|nr:hypothetical protein [Acidimicrobiales bacterium]